MNKFKILCLSFLIIGLSCNKEKENTTSTHDASVSIKFNMKSPNNSPYELGQTFSVNNTEVVLNFMKFYVCDFTLVREDNTEVVVKNYDLIDWNSLSKHTSFDITIPAGNYKAVKFGLGLNPTLNQTNGAEQPTNNVLSTSYGMYWDWASMYVFSKIEGYSDINGDNTITDPLRYHIGTEAFYRISTVPFSSILTIEPSKYYTLNLELLVDKIFKQNGSEINFPTESYTQSERSDHEQAVAEKIANNFQSAFVIQ